MAPPAARAAKHLIHGVKQMHANLVVERGAGSYIYAEGGKRYLDFTTGIGVANLGHCHPRITAAAAKAAGTIVHAQMNIHPHRPMLNLMDKLADGIVPPELDSYFFWNGGADAIEAAIKLARHATGRQNVIVFQGGYHGRTVGTMSLTTSSTIYRAGYGPLMPGGFVAPFPYLYHSPMARFGAAAWAAGAPGADRPLTGYHYDGPPEAGTARVGGRATAGGALDSAETARCVSDLEMLLATQTAPAETAAVLIEPVLGEGGYVPASRAFLRAVRRLCDQHGMLMIADEVQTGFGRTGAHFCAPGRYGVVPDVLVFAKGIANGFPLSGLATRSALSDRQPPGSQGGTFGGNAVSCAVAAEVVDVFREERVLENVASRGKQLALGLESVMRGSVACIGADLRGLGLMVGMEFDRAVVGKGFAAEVAMACGERGMLLLTAGVHETLRFIPPLNASEAEVDEGVNIFGKALDAVTAQRRLHPQASVVGGQGT